MSWLHFFALFFGWIGQLTLWYLEMVAWMLFAVKLLSLGLRWRRRQTKRLSHYQD